MKDFWYTYKDYIKWQLDNLKSELFGVCVSPEHYRITYVLCISYMVPKWTFKFIVETRRQNKMWKNRRSIKVEFTPEQHKLLFEDDEVFEYCDMMKSDGHVGKAVEMTTEEYKEMMKAIRENEK